MEVNVTKTKKEFKKAKKQAQENPHSAGPAGNLIRKRKKRRKSIMDKLNK